MASIRPSFMLYYIDMAIEFAQYSFWIIICIPIVVTGVWFAVKLTKENREINKEIDEIKKEKEKAALHRKQFEISYNKKYSGDK